MMRAMIGCGLVLVFGAACNEGAQQETTVPLLDVSIYTTQVQPIVGVSCGSLDCHGVGGRPLRIYAVDGLRMTDQLRNQPISGAELEANARSFAFVSAKTSDVDAHLALAKPLAHDAGGYEHVGGDIWESNADPAYVCVRAWLSGTSNAAACTAGVPPPLFP